MTFSVIIPTFNRPKQLGQCLAALSRAAYPKDQYEVIVVDDGGSADLGPVVAPVQDALNVRLIRQRHSGPASARNNGAARATGRLLAFTDDDCEPDGNWLRALRHALESRPEALVGGRVINALTENVYAVASQMIIDYCFAHFNADPANARFFSTNNIAVAAELYRQAGGFDRSFRFASEDRDFCDRWLSRGLKLALSPEAVVLHRHAMDLRGFWRQQFAYGRGARVYATARRRRGAGPVPFEGWRFHLGMLAAPTVNLCALALMSQTAVAAGYAWEWLRLLTAGPE
jgi:GT2 family glycosyltransferase